jgi:acylphosphatase
MGGNIAGRAGRCLAGNRREQNRCATDGKCGFIRHQTSRGQRSGRVRGRVADQMNLVSPMARERLHIYYSGRVQGVGFRATVKQVALGYEVTGTVRNLADGRVELQAEGEPLELEAFQLAIRDSGLGHFIRQEDARRVPAENQFRGFQIVR